jgi:hypothetical protein
MSRADASRAEAEKRTRAALAAQQLVDEQIKVGGAVRHRPNGPEGRRSRESRQFAARATYRTRRFEVSGIDDLGAVQIFETDDPERARNCLYHAEELRDVESIERT